MLKYNSARKLRSFNWSPVVVTDSKGKYLRKYNFQDDKIDQKITWLGRSGFSFEDEVKFLSKDKLKALIKYHRRISLCVFIGSYDFTVKGKRYIRLKKPTGVLF